jgi:hypothetical protein
VRSRYNQGWVVKSSSEHQFRVNQVTERNNVPGCVNYYTKKKKKKDYYGKVIITFNKSNPIAQLKLKCIQFSLDIISIRIVGDGNSEETQALYI